MKKVLFLVLVCLLIVAPSVTLPTSTENVVYAKTATTKKVSKTETKIKKVAKSYAYTHCIEGFRYESPIELLEENYIKATKGNIKLMKKWVKYYEMAP